MKNKQKLKAPRPGLEARQREGRAIWWDKTAIEPDEAKRQLDSKVPQKSYPYQTKT